MNVTFHDVEQRSEAWHKLRLGRLTSSRSHDMLATHKDGKTPSASRRNLLVQLLLERLTGRSHERNFTSGPMQDGIDREGDAVATYEILARPVQPVGFISHNELMVGCSPDGLIGEDGSVSIKCPIPATHLQYLRTGVVPREYLDQIHHELWLTGRQWCDFLSYQPDFADLKLESKIVRVMRDEKAIKDYEQKALAFLKEIELEVDAVRTMAGLGEVLKAS